MSAELTIRVSEELLADLQAKAAESGKTMDEVAEETLRTGLEERAWQELIAYGRERGQASGYTEDDVPGLVKEWRREQRRS